jgi:CRISPR-associated protein Cmr1
MDELIVQMKTITPVWTAGISHDSGTPREIGLNGSLRWWYEALVRGLGGFACDPTDNDRCAFDDSGYRTGGVDDGLRTVCAACRLFGCGGWSSKFRLLVTGPKGEPNISLDEHDVDFLFRFLLNKPLSAAELWLLNSTFSLIDQHGSIGGRTTLKPPKHPDYGQIKVVKNLPLPKKVERSDVVTWLVGLTKNSASLQQRESAQSSEIPRLDLFFFKTGQWIDARQMNELVRVDHSGFMAGKRGVSKKVFSFQSTKRLWGYTRDQKMLDSMLQALERMRVHDVKTGQEIIYGL